MLHWWGVINKLLITDLEVQSKYEGKGTSTIYVTIYLISHNILNVKVLLKVTQEPQIHWERPRDVCHYSLLKHSVYTR